MTEHLFESGGGDGATANDTSHSELRRLLRLSTDGRVYEPCKGFLNRSVKLSTTFQNLIVTSLRTAYELSRVFSSRNGKLPPSSDHRMLDFRAPWASGTRLHRTGRLMLTAWQGNVHPPARQHTSAFCLDQQGSP